MPVHADKAADIHQLDGRDLPASSVPFPSNRRIMPRSAADHMMTSRTEYCLPVAMTKPSGPVLSKHHPLHSEIILSVPHTRKLSILFMQRYPSTPCVIFASSRVILRVTKVSPRRRLSSLKRIPLQIYTP